MKYTDTLSHYAFISLTSYKELTKIGESNSITNKYILLNLSIIN